MQLYRMECTIDGDDLYELKDGRFQFLRSGETAPLMGEFKSDGAYHVLVENTLADFLRSLDLDQVTFKPAVLWHRATDKEVHTHALVSIGRCHESGPDKDNELDGRQMYYMSNMRFSGVLVSSLLKDALEKEGFEYLQFGKW